MGKIPKVILMVLLAAITTARADVYVYDWSYSSSLYTGSGTLSVDSSAPQEGGGVPVYVPVISGTFNGQAITGLDNSGGYNNFLYFQDSHGSYTLTSPTQPLWQVTELALTTASDEYVMNVDNTGSGETFDINNGGSGVGGADDAYDSLGNPIGNTGNFSLVAVPEPSTIIAGLFMLVPLGISALRVVRKK